MGGPSNDTLLVLTDFRTSGFAVTLYQKYHKKSQRSANSVSD